MRRQGQWLVVVALLGCSSIGIAAQKSMVSSPQQGATTHKFEVQGPESDSLGFAVTQPGPVAVEVQSNGAPIEVTLIGPASAPVKQRGNGQVRLAAQATPQDVQRSPFWRVQIRAWCEEDCRTAAKRPRSSGSITVQHPPVDQRAVQVAMQAISAQPKQPSQSPPAQAAAQAAKMEQAFQQRKAQLEQQQQQRRAALFARMQPQANQLRSRAGTAVPIKPVAIEQGKAQAVTSTTMPAGQSPAQPPLSQSGPGQAPPMTVVSSAPGLTTRLSKQPPASQQAPTMTVAPINPALLAAPGFGASTPPQGGSSTGAGSTTPPPPPPPSATPVITSLSVAQGQPGDPVMINGTNFGSGVGEIHFVIAPGKDLVAAAGAIWTDTQIFASVPVASGVTAFSGQVYIKRAADKKMSNLASFRFEPTLEIRELRATMDRLIQEPFLKGPYSTTDIRIEHNRAGDVFGAKGNDELFRTGRLKNGWIVEDVFVIPSYVFNSAGAYVWDSRKGTNSPYLNVRWWADPFSVVGYHFGVRIIGPLGVPDGIKIP